MASLVLIFIVRHDSLVHALVFIVQKGWVINDFDRAGCCFFKV